VRAVLNQGYVIRPISMVLRSAKAGRFILTKTLDAKLILVYTIKLGSVRGLYSLLANLIPLVRSPPASQRRGQIPPLLTRPHQGGFAKACSMRPFPLEWPVLNSFCCRLPRMSRHSQRLGTWGTSRQKTNTSPAYLCDRLETITKLVDTDN
jgi:hypothetical protein